MHDAMLTRYLLSFLMLWMLGCGDTATAEPADADVTIDSLDTSVGDMVSAPPTDAPTTTPADGAGEDTAPDSPDDALPSPTDATLPPSDALPEGPSDGDALPEGPSDGDALPEGPSDGDALPEGVMDGLVSPIDTFTEDVPDMEDTLGATDTGPDTESPEPLPFLESYGALETLAGTAYITGKAVNGWGLTFEGGPALVAELSRPHMTLADGAGRLFIADKDAHAIRRVDLDGTIHTVAGINEVGNGPDMAMPGTAVALDSPNGIWVHADSTVYILDLGNMKIRRLAPDGTLETFFYADGLATGRGLWVADDEMLAYVSSGTNLLRWTPETGVEIMAEGFISLGNLAVLPNGQLAVTDRGGNRAYWVGNNGALLPFAGTGGITGGGDGFSALDTGLEGLRGIWFPPDGGMLLCVHAASKLYWMDDDGILRLMLDGISDGTHAGDGEHWSTPGPKISEPRAVTMDHAGNILLTEHDGGYIRRIVRTGPLP